MVMVVMMGVSAWAGISFLYQWKFECCDDIQRHINPRPSPHLFGNTKDIAVPQGSVNTNVSKF